MSIAWKKFQALSSSNSTRPQSPRGGPTTPRSNSRRMTTLEEQDECPTHRKKSSATCTAPIAAAAANAAMTLQRSCSADGENVESMTRQQTGLFKEALLGLLRSMLLSLVAKPHQTEKTLDQASIKDT